ncbi:MAG: hypothetical protein JSW71_00515 [Gemmatimonadota bacterium]|nr:MAG: hypothetical protein JSW71_00515 [Gemmatimonadota bacterium]
MNRYLIGSILMAALWILLALIVAIPTGWVHVPLVAAVLLIVRAVVDGQRS